MSDQSAQTETPEQTAADGAAPPAGLLDAVPDEAPGNRPEWLPGQFWDDHAKAPKLEALAKSWSDLRSKVAREGMGVPPADASEYRLPQVDGVPPDLVRDDDPLWSEIRVAARAAGVTQAQLEALAKPYLAAVAKARESQGQPADPEAEKRLYEAEIARLGPHGPAVLREVKAWLGGLVSRGILTEAELAALKLVSTADGVRAFSKLRTLAGEKPIPLTALEDGRMSYQDATRMMREAIEKRDEALGRQAERALRELAARGMLPTV